MAASYCSCLEGDEDCDECTGSQNKSFEMYLFCFVLIIFMLSVALGLIFDNLIGILDVTLIEFGVLQ